MTGVRIRFEGYNSTGNNIYIDNINISGTSSNLAPVAGFNANGNIQVCSNTGVLFSNTSLNNPATYNWTFEGGSPASSGQFAPIINWTTPGTYDVQLIVSNSAGSDTLIQADFIEILPLPSISITATPDSICQGVQVQLEVSGGAAYLWNAGPGLQVTDSPVVTVSPSVTSTYSASGISDQGCSNTASSQITVLNPPAAPSISENNFLLVAPQAVSYQWYVNGLEIANSDTMFLQPLLNGNYNLRIYDQYGCTSISAPYAVNWVGVDDVKRQPLLVIPNPANTNVRVTCGEKMEQIQVYSAAGQLIFSSLLNAAQTHLITENWSNGLYLIRIQTHSGERSMRLVVAH